jgi:hypothetical protein
MKKAPGAHNNIVAHFINMRPAQTHRTGKAENLNDKHTNYTTERRVGSKFKIDFINIALFFLEVQVIETDRK